MNILRLLFTSFLSVVTAHAEPVKIFFDTGMETDCDDAGAMAVLHTLADRGECEILATVTSVRDPASIEDRVAPPTPASTSRHLHAGLDFYFPMQKVLKILPRISSLSALPTTPPTASSAPRSSSAMNSGDSAPASA